MKMTIWMFYLSNFKRKKRKALEVQLVLKLLELGIKRVISNQELLTSQKRPNKKY